MGSTFNLRILLAIVQHTVCVVLSVIYVSLAISLAKGVGHFCTAYCCIFYIIVDCYPPPHITARLFFHSLCTQSVHTKGYWAPKSRQEDPFLQVKWLPRRAVFRILVYAVDFSNLYAMTVHNTSVTSAGP